MRSNSGPLKIKMEDKRRDVMKENNSFMKLRLSVMVSDACDSVIPAWGSGGKRATAQPRPSWLQSEF